MHCQGSKIHIIVSIKLVTFLKQYFLTIISIAQGGTVAPRKTVLIWKRDSPCLGLFSNSCSWCEKGELRNIQNTRSPVDSRLCICSHCVFAHCQDRIMTQHVHKQKARNTGRAQQKFHAVFCIFKIHVLLHFSVLSYRPTLYDDASTSPIFLPERMTFGRSEKSDLCYGMVQCPQR